MIFVGAGKGALAVAEQFAFDEVGGDGAAVYRHKRLLGARAAVMQSAGDEFLTGAGFTVDKYRRVDLRQGGNFVHQFAHGGTAAHRPGSGRATT